MKPFMQRLFTWIGYVVAGFLALATVLGAVSNTLNLVTRTVTYIGTGVLILAWIVAQVGLWLRPLPWVTTDGTSILVKRLGVASTMPLVGVIMLLWAPVLRAPKLVLTCASRIERHEATIYGTAPADSHIALSVHPRDGSSEYWLQGGGNIEVSADGTWGYLARFGNPFAIGHKEPWPLYDIYAVALHGTTPPPNAAAIAKSDDAAHCSVKRDPEPAIACKAQALKILSPEPLSCPFAAENLANPNCDPRELVKVHSPVVFRWEPAVQVFAELYRDGRAPVLPQNFRDKFNGPSPLESGLTIPLPSGEYEFKIVKQRDGRCKTSAWFVVLDN